MPVYKAPARDTRFVLNEVLKLEQYAHLPTFANAGPEMVDTIVEECGKFASEVLAPLNQSGDQQGCVRNPDGSVVFSQDNIDVPATWSQSYRHRYARRRLRWTASLPKTQRLRALS